MTDPEEPIDPKVVVPEEGSTPATPEAKASEVEVADPAAVAKVKSGIEETRDDLAATEDATEGREELIESLARKISDYSHNSEASLGSIVGLLKNKYMEERVKFETSLALLNAYQAEIADVTDRDKEHASLPFHTKGLRNFFDILTSYKEVFSNYISDEQYRKLLLTFSEKISYPMTHPLVDPANHRGYPIWRIGDVCNNFKMLEQIAEIVPVPKLEEYRRATKTIVEKNLARHIDIQLFTEKGRAGDHESIKAFAAAFSIELPSEESLWKEEATSLKAEMVEAVAEMDGLVEEQHLGTKLKPLLKRVEEAKARLLAARESLGEDFILEDYESLEQWFDEIDAGVREVRKSNEEFFLRKKFSDMRATVEEGNPAKMQNLTANSYTPYFEARDRLEIQLMLKTLIADQLQWMDGVITKIAAQIAENPDTAKKESWRLVVLGQLRSDIDWAGLTVNGNIERLSVEDES